MASGPNNSVQSQEWHVHFETRVADNSLNDILTNLTLTKFLSQFLTACIFLPNFYAESRHTQEAIKKLNT